MENNNVKELEQELIKNNYTYMDHCFSGTKLGEESIESLSKRIDENNDSDNYSTIIIRKEFLGEIISMLLNYEDLLWEKYCGSGPKNNAWDVGDMYEILHDITTELGYKVYIKTDKTPKECKMNDHYVI